MQLAAVKGFSTLFGPYKVDEKGDKKGDQQRWADYQRLDWSLRQLPVMNVFEAGQETKDSDNGFLTGTVQIQVYWPPSFRRSDLARVPAAFKGAIQNFFKSKYCSDMIDELWSIQRPMKVAGLSELGGKTLNWSPNLEGIIESDAVPATILDVGYKIDLRAWYRAIEAQGRTQDDPFDVTLVDLLGIDPKIVGVQKEDTTTVQVEVDAEFLSPKP